MVLKIMLNILIIPMLLQLQQSHELLLQKKAEQKAEFQKNPRIFHEFLVFVHCQMCYC